MKLINIQSLSVVANERVTLNFQAVVESSTRKNISVQIDPGRAADMVSAKMPFTLGLPNRSQVGGVVAQKEDLENEVRLRLRVKFLPPEAHLHV